MLLQPGVHFGQPKSGAPAILGVGGPRTSASRSARSPAPSARARAKRVSARSTGSSQKPWLRPTAPLARTRAPLEALDDGPLALASPAPDPELDYIKTRYRSEFKAAFQAALGALDKRERNVLRMHFLDGLGIDEIGAVYRVHRATVARWLARARELLLAETRRLLREKLGVGDAEFESLIAVVQSQLEVSIKRYLKKARD